VAKEEKAAGLPCSRYGAWEGSSPGKGRPPRYREREKAAGSPCTALGPGKVLLQERKEKPPQWRKKEKTIDPHTKLLAKTDWFNHNL